MMMPTRLLALTLLAAPLIVAQPAKVEGKWNASLQLENINSHPVLNFKQDGEKLTGTYEGYYGVSQLEGKVKDNQIGFVVAMTIEGSKIEGVFNGTVDGDSMAGSVEFEGAGAGKWTAVRAK